MTLAERVAASRRQDGTNISPAEQVAIEAMKTSLQGGAG